MKRSKRLISILILAGVAVGCAAGEYVVAKKRPQRLYTQARASSMQIFAPSSEMVFTLKPNTQAEFRGYTGEFASQVTVNGLGLRGREVSRNKPAGTYRVLVTGDSMVFGWGVNDGETFAAQLEQQLNAQKTEKRYEILNAGFTSGNAPTSAYLYLKNHGLALRPDIVIFTIFPHNDLGDLEEGEWIGSDENGLPRRVISKVVRVDDGYLVAKAQPIKYRFPLLRNSHLFQLIVGYLQQRRILPAESTGRDYAKPYCVDLTKCNEAFEKYQKVMHGLAALANQSDVPIVVLFLASPVRVEEGANLMHTYHQKEFESGSISARVYDNGLRLGNYEPRKTLMTVDRDIALPVIDMLPDLVHRDWREYFYGSDGHLTRTGHQKVAETLRQFLREGRYTL